MTYLIIGLGILAGSLTVVILTVAIDSYNERRLRSRQIDEEYHFLCLSQEI